MAAGDGQGEIAGVISPPDHSISAARRRWGLALSGVALAAIAWLTLRPGLGEVGIGTNWTSTDVALNVLLFLPLGAGLVLAGLRPLHAVVVGVLASAGIEGAQRWLVSGRVASLIDVASNGLGALAGALAVTRWGARSRWWPWVGKLVATIVILAWIIGGYVAQPAIPGPAGWVSEWATGAPDSIHVPLKVLDVRLQHRALPPGPVVDAGDLRAQLMASRKTIYVVRFIWPAPSDDSVAIAQVMVGERRARFLSLVKQGTTLRAYQRTGLRWVGLPTPWIQLRSRFHPAQGDTVEVRLVGNRRALELSATARGQAVSARLRLAPELYFSAQWNRATDGVLWWWVLPAGASLFVLGFALARRPVVLAAVFGFLLIWSAVGGGSALPSALVWVVGMLAAWGGRRSALALGLFPASPTAGRPG